jgi:hypothetical protein
MSIISDESMKLSNKPQFQAMRRGLLKDKMKKHIFQLMLEEKETDFFDLDRFNREYVQDTALTLHIAAEIREELHSLGWKTHLGFGDTGLYVYSTEELPVGAY